MVNRELGWGTDSSPANVTMTKIINKPILIFGFDRHFANGVFSARKPLHLQLFCLQQGRITAHQGARHQTCNQTPGDNARPLRKKRQKQKVRHHVRQLLCESSRLFLAPCAVAFHFLSSPSHSFPFDPLYNGLRLVARPCSLCVKAGGGRVIDKIEAEQQMGSLRNLAPDQWEKGQLCQRNGNQSRVEQIIKV